jgi:hypothetical protein
MIDKLQKRICQILLNKKDNFNIICKLLNYLFLVFDCFLLNLIYQINFLYNIFLILIK